MADNILESMPTPSVGNAKIGTINVSSDVVERVKTLRTKRYAHSSQRALCDALMSYALDAHDEALRAEEAPRPRLVAGNQQPNDAEPTGNVRAEVDLDGDVKQRVVRTAKDGARYIVSRAGRRDVRDNGDGTYTAT